MDRGKKITDARKKIDKATLYSLDDAVNKVKELKFAKFDETVEASMKLVHKSYQNVRGSVTLPGGTGKQVKVLVICKGDSRRKRARRGIMSCRRCHREEKQWIDFSGGRGHPRHDERGGQARPGWQEGPDAKPKAGTVRRCQGLIRSSRASREYKAIKGRRQSRCRKCVRTNVLIENIKAFYNQS